MPERSAIYHIIDMQNATHSFLLRYTNTNEPLHIKDK